MTLYFEPEPERARELVAAARRADVHVATSLAELADRAGRRPRRASWWCSAPAWRCADALRLRRPACASASPALGVVLLRDAASTSDVLAEAMRAGVREVVAGRRPGGVRRRLRALAGGVPAARRAGVAAACPAPARGTASVVTVFAGKGGCGKSTVATNLAVALAAGGAAGSAWSTSTCPFGDVGDHAAARRRSAASPTRSPMAGRLDETGAALAAHHVRARAWTRCSPRPGRPRASGSTASWSPRCSASPAAMFDYIVVDTPPYFSDQVLAALDVTDWLRAGRHAGHPDAEEPAARPWTCSTCWSYPQRRAGSSCSTGPTRGSG